MSSAIRRHLQASPNGEEIQKDDGAMIHWFNLSMDVSSPLVAQCQYMFVANKTLTPLRDYAD